MDHSVWVWVLFVGGGLLAGAFSYLALLLMPEPWLRDAVPSDAPEPQLPEPRVRFLPFGLLWMLACGALAAQALAAYGPGPVAAVCILALVPLSILFAADVLTRILPDQAVVALAVVGVLLFVLGLVPSIADDGAVPGAFAAGAPWWADSLNRVGAGLAGAFFLWLAGWIGGRLLRTEAMGMGDVKLLAAGGLVAGLFGLVAVLLVAFVSGAFFAVPALIRKYGRRAREEADADANAGAEAGPGSGAEPGTEPVVDAAPSADGTLPFGPFLVLGLVAALFFRDALARLAGLYLGLF